MAKNKITYERDWNSERYGRPPRHPAWKDGIETPKEEALWPYVTCTIASRQLVTQNIGIVKSMAKDKAINRREDVPIIVHLPGGAEYTIVFHPDGRQEMTDIKE